MFAARLIEILTRAGSGTRSCLVATFQSFSFSFWRSHTFRTSSGASRRRCSSQFFATFSLTRFSILRRAQRACDALRTRDWASRRRCSTEFFTTFAFTRLPVLWSVRGYGGSRRLRGRQARTRLGLLTEFPLAFATFRESRACGWRR